MRDRATRSRAFGIAQFFERFPDEDACLEHIFACRWGDHSPCPRCEQLGSWRRIRGTKKWRHSCGRHVSVLKGTIFYRSNLPMMAWFYGLLLFANATAGMRTGFIRKQLGLGLRGAFRLCRMIRVHMATMPRPVRLGGTGKRVHVDEVHLRYLVDREGGPHRSAIVMGIECDGEVICGIVPDRRAETLVPILVSRVAAGSIIVTDMLGAYARLEKHGFEHIRINHSVAFHDFQGNTNNRIEAFWATVRRSLRSYRQVSAENLWLYLAEIEFRYNRRHVRDTGFIDLITRFESYDPNCEDIWRSRYDWSGNGAQSE